VRVKYLVSYGLLEWPVGLRSLRAILSFSRISY